MTDIERFDDLVRTERYFTATLLPAILLHNNCGGLSAFLERVNDKPLCEWNCHYKRNPLEPDGLVLDRVEHRLAAAPFSLGGVETPDQAEIITEFHIKRDVVYFKKRNGENNASKGLETLGEKHSAPDLIIVVGEEMVICEGKFFAKLGQRGLRDLDSQLRSQRKQVDKFLVTARKCSRYRHFALLPERYDHPPDCSGVITWREVAPLAGDVLGPAHYVTQRLERAIRYYEEVTGDSGAPYFNGVLPLTAAEEGKSLGMEDRCREEGDRILVGHRDGAVGLRARSLDYAESKPWKWRWLNPPEALGHIVDKNWIRGKEFLEVIEALRNRSTPEKGRNLDQEQKSAGTKYFSGVLPLEVLLEKCASYEGEWIQVGHRDGAVGLRLYSIEAAKSKWWRWRDTRDKSLGRVIAKNWMTGKEFVEAIEELRDGAMGPAAVGQTG
ncbi:MAG TPA: hypothetical protein VJP78_13435 [Thermoleophilia bacterium]|nr:hypothetical protein [Thermoleophilia bacterium]